MNENDHEEYEYVGFWPRAAAFLIDLVAFFCIFLSGLFVLGAILGGIYAIITGRIPADDDPSLLIMEGIGVFLQFIVPPIVWVWFWSTKQATPGKMAFKIKIVDSKTGGAPTIGQCTGRYFGYIISGLAFYLGFIWVAFDARRQGWHDKMAGTVVIRQKGAKFGLDHAVVGATDVKFDDD